MASNVKPTDTNETALPPLSEITTLELALDSAGPEWAELLELARQPGVCNLGQGYPDYEGSSVARAAAAEAMTKSDMSLLNQYSFPSGSKSLQGAVCSYYNKHYELKDGATKRALKPENVLITIGATEGLFASLRTVAGPGDEVIMFNPGFLWYVTTIRLAGATPVMVMLDGPDFAPDLAKVEKAITPNTKALLLNTPHNPCGHCYTKQEVEGLARLARKHNLYIVSDEVYENVTFGDAEHIRIADEEGMFERTITLCSASKLFSLTGWRVGWALSTPALLKGVMVHHMNMSYCAPSPLQHGLAVALEAEDGTFEGIPKIVEENARILGDALREKGFGVSQPKGGHFLVADTSGLGMKGSECARFLLKEAKVATVPGMIFFLDDPKGAGGEDGMGAVDKDIPLLRFAICKRRDTIDEAVRRIRAMNPPAQPSA
uniref:Aspartate aminotransferase n=1 Tax=Dictyopteris undulata TaxID=156997 RepID=A0A097IUV4_9PHAE|nr:aspartate aminotransferase [Dictyopteris undulata]